MVYHLHDPAQLLQLGSLADHFFSGWNKTRILRKILQSDVRTPSMKPDTQLNVFDIVLLAIGNAERFKYIDTSPTTTQNVVLYQLKSRISN